MRAAALSGAVSRNELRAAVGLDPVPWGELPLVPGNMVQIDGRTGEPRTLETIRVSDPAPQEDASAKLLDILMAGQRMLVESHMKLAEAVGKMMSSAARDTPQ